MAKRFGYALKCAQHALRVRMDEALRPLGLTTPQYSVLSAVEFKAGMSNAALARQAFITPQAMQGVLANLERDGLLVRSPDPNHGRILRSGLSAHGRSVLRKAHLLVSAVENIVILSLGSAQAGQMCSLLSHCAQQLMKSTD